MTCGGFEPSARSLVPQSSAIARAIAGFHASQAARAVSMSSVSPARSQPSNTGSSPAILLMSIDAKSTTPSLVRRRMVLSWSPIRSSGWKSAVILPPDASGIVSFQNGTSSSVEATVRLFSPTALTLISGRLPS
jgi:hypothetical protein